MLVSLQPLVGHGKRVCRYESAFGYLRSRVSVAVSFGS